MSADRGATVLQVQRWQTNAELLKAVFEMHVYPRWAIPRVLDPTWGRGTWWKDWLAIPEPARRDLVTLPIDFERRDRKLDPAFDFRKMDEFADNSFDVVAFDPDYVAPGGRTTSTIGEFNDRYGLDDEYESPASLQYGTINPGLTECARVLDAQGLLLVKCTNYVSSGKPWAGVFETWMHATKTVGLRLHDEFVMLTDPMAQPADRKCRKCDGGQLPCAIHHDAYDKACRTCWLVSKACVPCGGTGRITPRQQHARSNSSTLLVFRKLGRRKR